MRSLLILTLVFTTSFSYADDVKKVGLYNESSLGYVVTGGNSEAETTNIAQKSEYYWTRDILKFEGNYLQAGGTTNGVTTQTAENWLASLRFERVLTPKKFNAYVSYGWHGDLFQEIREGQRADIGGKYYFYSSEELVLLAELGYQYSRELLRKPAAAGVGVGKRIFPEYHYTRSKLQIDYKHSKTLSMGAWVEYLASISTFADDQRINYSPYLTSVLTDIFSLKISYLGRYRYKPAAAGNKLTDFTFTTALLAKF